MKKTKHIIISVFIFALGLVPLFGTQNASAVLQPEDQGGNRAVCTGTNGRILTFPAWYRGLSQDPDTCAIKLTALNQIWQVVLNLIEIMLQVAGYVAAGFMVWGGFKYIKSQGNSQNIVSAKSTLMNAAIGLGIALSAVAIVNFISGRF